MALPSTSNDEPLHMKQLDDRILDIPVPFTFQDAAADNTQVQDALLPYFALGFIPVSTEGAKTHECGLYALMTSYNAARKLFESRNSGDSDEDDLAGSNALQETDFHQWKKMLHGNRYKKACTQLLNEFHNANGTADDDGAMFADMQQKTNLGADALSVLLRMANEQFGTNYRLGIIKEGWRGKWVRYEKVPEDSRDENGNLPITEWFDNRHIVESNAGMANLGVGDGPVIWIRNDNNQSRSMDQHDMACMNHWEGFAPSKDAQEDAERIKAIQTYGIGARLEEDISKGVWFLTRDYPDKDNEDQITASRGSFLRAPQQHPTASYGKLWMFMRACNGNTGWVNHDHLVRVEMALHAPRGATDPHPESMILPVGQPLPPVPAWPEPPKPDNKNKNKNKGKSTAPNPRGFWPYADKPFKLFRVIPPTTKTGTFIKNSPELKLKKEFKFENGDFVLDCQVDRKNLHAKVRDIHGVKEWVPLRRLQAVASPWGYPDTLPVENSEYYGPPASIEVAKELAEHHEYDDIDWEDEEGAKKEIGDRLDAKRKLECRPLRLYRMTEEIKATHKKYKAHSEEGEIVRQLTTDGAGRIMANYEGYKSRVLESSFEQVEGTFWGLKICRKEWKNQKGELKEDDLQLDQSDDEAEDEKEVDDKKKSKGGVQKSVPAETEPVDDDEDDHDAEIGYPSSIASDDQGDAGNQMDVVDSDESEEE